MTIERIGAMSVDELQVEWAARFGLDAPALGTDQLRLGLAYRLQEQRHGGLSRSTRNLLLQTIALKSKRAVAPPPVRKLTVGTRLIRDWHGVGHTVTVLEDGFEYEGKRWGSLSAIARAITGSRWNGPLFFGLGSRNK
ncbi:DUF2924 domain-containing protein [Novosphingobium olei]|nr:DUF2924 domain-containing protein [Novosphingobium olei]